MGCRVQDANVAKGTISRESSRALPDKGVSSEFVFITIHPYDLPTTDSAVMADTDPAHRAAGFEDLVKLMEKQTELTGRLLVETEYVRKGLAGASTSTGGNGMSKC